MSNMTTRTDTHAKLAEFVDFLNGTEPYYRDSNGMRWTTREVNETAATLVARGRIIEIPGTPYRWEVA